jgi:hypothetical protein
MPDPIPESVIEILREDRTAALAAAFVIASHHPDLWRFAAGMIRPSPSPSPVKLIRKRASKSNSHRREPVDGHLVETMEADPAGSIGDWAAAIGKSKTTVVTALKRLADAGRAESIDRRWRLVEKAPREPPPRWVEPVSARRAHAHA